MIPVSSFERPANKQSSVGHDPVAEWSARMRGLAAHESTSRQALLDVFLRGGAEAVRVETGRSRWLQISVAVRDSRVFDRKVMASLHGFATAALDDGSISNFFFMHKPPGLRIRFETDDRTMIRESAAPFLNALARLPAVSGVSESHYEPETQLFGGHCAMDHVHRLFTIDALMWSAIHAQRRTLDTFERWQLSFVWLRTLFEALGITGWEDLGVWAYLVTCAGRALPGRAPDPELAAQICAAWDIGTETAASALAARPDLARHLPILGVLAVAADQWRRGCFDVARSSIGPRQAAAYVTIFHWNRAGLPAFQQNLIATTLACRRAMSDAALDDLMGRAE